MDIGQKIKMIRTEKLMTQKELAGGVITRNMLSQIENGIANPSLSTVQYIADRLGVPAGYLLSEGAEEFVYNKTRVMKNIKRAYSDRNFELCREMCLSSFDEFDDELELILTDCCVGASVEYIKEGRLRLACEMLDEAIRHSRKTIYSTVTQLNRAYLMFYLLKTISPSLDSDEIDTEISEDLLHPSLFGDVFCKYVTVILGNDTVADIDGLMFNSSEVLSDEDKLFIAHLRARIYMHNKDYKKASVTLRSIMDGETVPQRLLLYICCADIEQCYKELEDYKGAYEFAGNKMEILEHMLAEI